MEPGPSNERMGVVHLAKNTEYVRKPKRTKRTNFVRQRLTKQDKEDMKFHHFEPIYQMWCDYFHDILHVRPSLVQEIKDGTREIRLDDRFLKIDYHGAMLYVSEADNQTMVGISGIVTLETRNTVQMMTEKDKYIVIPKQGTTFQFVFEGQVFTLFGDAIRFQPTLRGKKAKSRVPLPFLLK